ncbi:hypothetical protein BASA61_005513 [Batrachochytrium salamandrivorans]|nr:hypothetical protein BASA61_005513 [Batrachochytrium salamandrivorans]
MKTPAQSDDAYLEDLLAELDMPITKTDGFIQHLQLQQTNIDELLSELGDIDQSEPFQFQDNCLASKFTSISLNSLPVKALEVAVSNSKTRRCHHATLGGAMDKMGYNYSCDRLRCIRCDFNCLSFSGRAWNDQCDYLFFRNHMPDPLKLEVNLMAKPGVRSYCCQCSWTSVSKNTAVKSTLMRWGCGGHPE